MSHKTMIDGVAYEISGGKTLIDGTAFSIKNGKTLVGGTAYEVGFDDGMRTITLIRDYDGRNSGIITIGDDRYMDGGSCDVGGIGNWTSPTTIEVPVGTQMYYSTEYEDTATEVIVNGSVVYSGKGDYITWPEWPNMYTVTKNMTLVMSKRIDWETYYCTVYTLTITEE